MKYQLVLMLSFSWILSLPAQDYPRKNIDPSLVTDELLGAQDQDVQYEQLYENLIQQLADPINLNKTNAEALRFLPLLTEAQIQSLLTYRAENGELLSIYELQAIPDFDLTTIYKLVPFVQVVDPGSIVSTSILKRALSEKNNYFMVRYERSLEKKKGYSSPMPNENKFNGSPDKLYIRLRTSKPGDFSFGFTLEKDAGEQWLWKPSSKRYGFDFLSAHAQIQNKGKLKNMILGDFQNQFGQALMLGGAFGMGKGAETITTTRRNTIGSVPYTSANEFGLLRGIGLTYEIMPGVSASGFISHIKRDVSLSEKEEDESTASSFQTNGLHRNESELQNRKKILENNTGVIIQYAKTNFDVGVMFNDVRFSRPVEPKLSLYNQFGFRGSVNQNIGAYFRYNVNNFLVSGEFSKSLRAGTAGIISVMGSLTNHFDVSFVYRKFGRDFHTFYSNAFSEGTTPQNETGIYWGWKYRWNRKFTLSGYLDMFRFPWLRFRVYSPSTGYEWLLRLSYQPSKQVLIFLQAREEKKLRNIDRQPNLYQTAQGIKRNYWINFDYGFTPKLKMKTRAQFSSYRINYRTTYGVALIQDISVDFGRFGCSARHALFDTDDFDNRQYAYEQDVWLAYSLPAYDGKGVRNFIVLEYKMSKAVTFWLRYSRTRYEDREEIGTGVDKIEGNTKNDIKFQVRFKL